MSVVVYAESPDGKIKKAALEAVNYGAKFAKALNVDCVALVFGEANGKEELAEYGASKILHLQNDNLSSFDSQNYAMALAEVAKQQNATAVVMSHSASGKKYCWCRTAVRLQGGLVSGVNGFALFS